MTTLEALNASVEAIKAGKRGAKLPVPPPKPPGKSKKASRVAARKTSNPATDKPVRRGETLGHTDDDIPAALDRINGRSKADLDAEREKLNIQAAKEREIVKSPRAAEKAIAASVDAAVKNGDVKVTKVATGMTAKQVLDAERNKRVKEFVAKPTAKAKTAQPKTGTLHPGTKKYAAFEALCTKQGATQAELFTITGWKYTNCKELAEQSNMKLVEKDGRLWLS